MYLPGCQYPSGVIFEREAVEAPDNDIKGVFRPHALIRPPAVLAGSAYVAMRERTVRVGLPGRAAWTPVVRHNNGTSPGRIWMTQGGEGFRVEIVRMDDPAALRREFSEGRIHVAGATVATLALFMEDLRKNAAAGPRVFQAAGWSLGDDAVVIRRAVAAFPDRPRVDDLRGKKVVLPQTSPSIWFLWLTLAEAGLKTHDVDILYTQSAAQAVEAFQADETIAACLGWGAAIRRLAGEPEYFLLRTSTEYSGPTADVWFARADFARDHPDIIEGLARGLLNEVEPMNRDGAPGPLPGRFRPAGCAANQRFFLDANYPFGFENTWNRAVVLNKRLGMATHREAYQAVLDVSALNRISETGPCPPPNPAHDVTGFRWTPEISLEGGRETLINKAIVHFAPNSAEFARRAVRLVRGSPSDAVADPDARAALAEIARMLLADENRRIVITGHTDASRREKVSPDKAVELASRRARAVARFLVEEYGVPAHRVETKGLGWDRPADPDRPQHHLLNRRVEVTVRAAGPVPESRNGI